MVLIKVEFFFTVGNNQLDKIKYVYRWLPTVTRFFWFSFLLLYLPLRQFRLV